MKLRTKLLLGFSGVLVIVLIMGVFMNYSLNIISSQSKAVDATDSAVAETLMGQAHMLRFMIYQDNDLATQTKTAFATARKFFEKSSTFLEIPENLKDAQERIGEIDTLNSLLEQYVTLNRKAQDLSSQLVPAGVKIGVKLEQLRKNLRTMLSENFTENMFAFYNTTITVGETFRDARLAARVYASAPNSQNEKIALDSLKLTIDTIKTLDGQSVYPQNLALAKELMDMALSYEKQFRGMISATGESREATAKMRTYFNAITKGSFTLSSSVTGSLLGTASTSQNSMIICTVLIMLVCLGVAFFLTRNVLVQLGKDPGVLADIAQRVSDGDFNVDDGSQRVGVYGNIIRMVDSLKENIAKAKEESTKAQEHSQKAQLAMAEAESSSREAQSKTTSMLQAADKLETVANIVSSASSELAAQIEQSERGSSEQASRVTETATAMEEMNSTVLEVAKNAGIASDVSTSTRQKAEAGAAIVRKAVASIQAVQSQSLQLKTDMTKLDENAKSISQIMGVISDIADQTNLLALNAAIEAARAGEAGRGFAVVADEVRKLAEKTMASTTDVGNAIRSIQASTSQSMIQMDTSVKTIEEATEYANQSGAALDEIVSMVDNTADQVRAIATASEQQSASSEEINQSINQINTIASETARAMQEAARAVSDMANQAQVLSQLIDDMKRA